MEELPPDGATLEWHAASQFGPYRLMRLLGRGGFGAVYAAEDTAMGRVVALKLLAASYSHDPGFRERLFREARTAGRLHNPHVVPIHSCGEIDGQLFIDMRLIDGTDLRTVLAQEGPMGPARAVAIVGQIASALDAAHADTVVHRDVKPANILLTDDDFACLVDFGLANAATDAKLTTAGTTIGTFSYLAPERLVEEGQVDYRSDIYALTCVLYECLTGSPPYVARGDLPALIAAHLTAPIPRPSQRRPGVPTGFDGVIARGMAKDPDDRYASAGALAAAARRAAAGAAEPPMPNARAAGPAIGPATPANRRRPVVLLGTAIVGVVAAAATAITLSIHTRHGTPPAAPTPHSAGASLARIVANIAVGKRPEGVTVDPTTHTVYTANYSDNTVSVIDAASRTVTATIPVGKGPAWVAVDPATHTACTANNRDDTVSVIDTTSRTVTATIPVGTNPWGVAVDTTRHTAYVANMWDYTLTAIDLASRTVTATIPVGKNPYGVAVDPGAHTVYVANSSDGTLSVINTTSHTVTATIPVGNDPRGVALDPAAHRSYVTNESEGIVSVVNLDNHSVVAAIHVGNSPYGVAVDPGAHTVYSANHDNTVSVIDTTNLTVTGAIRIGKDTFELTVDPTTHTLYTANEDNTVSVIEPAQP